MLKEENENLAPKHHRTRRCPHVFLPGQGHMQVQSLSLNIWKQLPCFNYEINLKLSADVSGWKTSDVPAEEEM